MGMKIQPIPGLTCEASNKFIEALLDQSVGELNQADEKKIQRIIKRHGVNNGLVLRITETVLSAIAGLLIIPPLVQISQLGKLEKSCVKEIKRYNKLAETGQNLENLATVPEDVREVFKLDPTRARELEEQNIGLAMSHLLVGGGIGGEIEVGAVLPLLLAAGLTREEAISALLPTAAVFATAILAGGAVAGAVLPTMIKEEAKNCTDPIEKAKKCRNNLKDFAKQCLDQVAQNQKKIVEELEAAKKLNEEKTEKLARKDRNIEIISNMFLDTSEEKRAVEAHNLDLQDQVKDQNRYIYRLEIAIELTEQKLQSQVQQDQTKIQNLENQLAEQEENRIGVSQLASRVDDWVQECLECLAQKDEEITQIQNEAKAAQAKIQNLENQLVEQEDNQVRLLNHLTSRVDVLFKEYQQEKDKEIERIQTEAQATIEDLQRQTQRDQLEIQNLKRQLAEQQKSGKIKRSTNRIWQVKKQ